MERSSRVSASPPWPQGGRCRTRNDMEDIYESGSTDSMCLYERWASEPQKGSTQAERWTRGEWSREDPARSQKLLAYLSRSALCTLLGEVKQIRYGQHQQLSAYAAFVSSGCTLTAQEHVLKCPTLARHRAVHGNGDHECFVLDRVQTK